MDYDKVIDRLKTKGWRKGDYGQEAGPNCLIGACVYVEAEQVGYDAAARAWMGRGYIRDLNRIIEEQFPERGRGYGPHFNDHPDTTLADVILVLEKARANQ